VPKAGAVLKDRRNVDAIKYAAEDILGVPMKKQKAPSSLNYLLEYVLALVARVRLLRSRYDAAAGRPVSS